jgi:hypothetical protein
MEPACCCSGLTPVGVPAVGAVPLLQGRRATLYMGSAELMQACAAVSRATCCLPISLAHASNCQTWHITVMPP